MHFPAFLQKTNIIRVSGARDQNQLEGVKLVAQYLLDHTLSIRNPIFQ